jgi:hypothetical protein
MVDGWPDVAPADRVVRELAGSPIGSDLVGEEPAARRDGIRISGGTHMKAFPSAPFAVLAVTFAAAVLAACSDDTGNPTGPADLVGNYTLRTVNGASLPYTVGGAQESVILQGQMSLLTGNDYDLVLEVRDKNGDDTYLEAGYWGTFSIDSIFFVPDTEGTGAYRGTVGNGILRASTPDGLALQFQR